MAGVFMQSRGASRLIRISVWVAVLGLLLGIASSLVMASAAEAHAFLLKASPANGSVVHAPPSAVVLRFSEPVSTSFATVTVTDDSGRSVGRGAATVNGAVVTQTLSTGLPSSGYVVSYRIISNDGHPESDTTTFTLALPAGASASKPPGAASPAPSAGDAPTGARASVTGFGAGSSPVVRLALAVGVGSLALAVGTAFLAASRRREAS